jgi:hypothetical protein
LAINIYLKSTLQNLYIVQNAQKLVCHNFCAGFNLNLQTLMNPEYFIFYIFHFYFTYCGSPLLFRLQLEFIRSKIGIFAQFQYFNFELFFLSRQTPKIVAFFSRPKCTQAPKKTKIGNKLKNPILPAIFIINHHRPQRRHKRKPEANIKIINVIG